MHVLYHCLYGTGKWMSINTFLKLTCFTKRIFSNDDNRLFNLILVRSQICLAARLPLRAEIRRQFPLRNLNFHRWLCIS